MFFSQRFTMVFVLQTTKKKTKQLLFKKKPFNLLIFIAYVVINSITNERLPL